MRPLIFEFKETPLAEPLDLSLIEYDQNLNLSVDKETRLPAIEQLQLGTETYTRTDEVSDSEPTRIQMLMATETYTKVGGEESDPDTPRVSVLMATETITTSHDEGSDSDIDVPPERYHFSDGNGFSSQ